MKSTGKSISSSIQKGNTKVMPSERASNDQQSMFGDPMFGGGSALNSEELLNFDEIVLESNEIDLAELQKQPNFFERRFPQAIFLGIMIDGKRDGKGVMKYANGR